MLFHPTGPTWNKWYPTPRFAPDQVEVHVDCDVFLLDEPTEIRKFCKQPGQHKYLVLQEAFGEDWQYGSMRCRVRHSMPFINAGFFAQHATADITEELSREYRWWIVNVAQSKTTFHDEQGALAAALGDYFIRGDVYLLPRDRYRIISPRSNPELTDLSGTVLIHTTYPEHPAFRQFYKEISATSGLT